MVTDILILNQNDMRSVVHHVAISTVGKQIPGIDGVVIKTVRKMH